MNNLIVKMDLYMKVYSYFRLCLHTFKYTGRKNALVSSSEDSAPISTLSSASASAADGVSRRNNVAKARTLPARINPPTSNSDYTLETGTLTHSGRENLVETGKCFVDMKIC